MLPYRNSVVGSDALWSKNKLNYLHDPKREPTNLCNWGKKFRASTGFERVTSANTGAMLYQLSYEATHWEPNEAPPGSQYVWLHSSVGRASHRYSRRSRVRIPLKPQIFFRILFPNCINWWAHGEDRAISCKLGLFVTFLQCFI